MKYLLLSFGIGVFTIALFYCVAMFAVRHQESVFAVVGYVMGAIIDLPFIYTYGADPKRPPSMFVSIVVYLSEAIIVGLLVYFIFLKS
ncbi:MAG TPA: hypothetical protein VN256_15905 [Pyrinomonadaceae bacterium]|nr:hypothetical protein [Pyrinomonadaceae bacterium]